MISVPEACKSQPPVAIGGVGGSGTRLVAQLLQGLDFHIGGDLNRANDLLWFTLLFKREEIVRCDDAEFDVLAQALVSGLRGGQPLDPATCAVLQDLSARDRPQHPASWLKERASSLSDAARRPSFHGKWGWKEPNTHVVIERLWQRMPALRYIHVVRHGLDMAYSDNQNQLKLWGPSVLGINDPDTPALSLAYWCRVHKRMQLLLAQNPDRMFWLDYDNFCRHPHEEFQRLRRFLALPVGTVPDLSVVRPPGEPRHAHSSLAGFAPSDLAYVSSLGYRIECREPSADAIT